MFRNAVRATVLALAALLLAASASAALAYVPVNVDSVSVTGRNSGFGAISPDGRYGYFTGQVPSSPAALTKVDLATMSISGSPLTFTTGENTPGRMAVTPDGSTILVGFGDGSHAPTLAKIDAATLTQTAAVALTGGSNSRPMAVAASPDGQYAYVGNGTEGGQGKVWKIRLSDMTIAAGPLNVGGASDAGSYVLMLSPDGANLYAADYNADPGSVYRISTSSMTVTGQISGTTPYVVAGAISPDGRYAYTTDFNINPAVATKYDLATMTQVGTATFPATATGVYGLAISPDGSTLYAADESHPIKVTPIATASMTVQTGTTVGGGSSYSNAVLASPDGRYIYVNDLSPSPNGVVYRVQVAAPTTLTVDRSGDGSGSVAGGSGAIDCGSTCTATFGPLATVTLVATPESGSEFDGWTGDCTGSSSTCTLTMAAARTATARFRKTADGGGSAPSTPSTTTASVPATHAASQVDAVRLPASVVRDGLSASPAGKVAVTLVCPEIAGGCDADGTLSALLPKGLAPRASIPRILARFAGVHIAEGRSKVIVLKLNKVEYQALRNRGITTIRAILSTRNHLNGGQAVITRTRIWLHIAPRAPIPAVTG